MRAHARRARCRDRTLGRPSCVLHKPSQLFLAELPQRSCAHIKHLRIVQGKSQTFFMGTSASWSRINPHGKICHVLLSLLHHQLSHTSLCVRVLRGLAESVAPTLPPRHSKCCTSYSRFLVVLFQKSHRNKSIL